MPGLIPQARLIIPRARLTVDSGGPVCDLNWPQLQSIASSAHGKPLRLAYANIQSLLDLEYANRYGINNAIVFAQLDPRSQSALNLRLAPETILIGQNGTVENVWPGLLSKQNVEKILKHLSPTNSRKGGESYVQ